MREDLRNEVLKSTCILMSEAASADYFVRPSSSFIRNSEIGLARKNVEPFLFWKSAPNLIVAPLTSFATSFLHSQEGGRVGAFLPLFTHFLYYTDRNFYISLKV